MTTTKLNPAPPAARTAGSQQQEVSCQRPLNIVAYGEGMRAADQDAENGTMTDCPHQRGTTGWRDWWKGYHRVEAANDPSSATGKPGASNNQ